MNRWSFGTECQSPCAKSEAGFVSLAAVLLWAYVSRYAGSAAAVNRVEFWHRVPDLVCQKCAADFGIIRAMDKKHGSD